MVTMSEFGRTAAENGNAGTDHGHGNVMMVLGGPVSGGRIYGKWPGLEPEQLFERRDLASPPTSATCSASWFACIWARSRSPCSPTTPWVRRSGW